MMLTFVRLALISALLSAPAQAENAIGQAPRAPWQSATAIDIKGIRIGMPRPEVEALIGRAEEFTVAGVKGALRSMSVRTTYREGRLDSLVFVFDAHDFDHVLRAVEAKFSALYCGQRGVLRNSTGASVGDVICYVDDETSRLSIIKRGSGRAPTRSGLMLTSLQTVAEADARTRARKEDI